MATTATASQSTAGPSNPRSGDSIPPQQRFQQLRSECQGIATKIGELETDAEEHRAVIQTLKETVAKTPDRTCYRMIGGILVERTAKDVLPALQTNLNGLQTVIESLAKQYKSRDEEAQSLQKQLQQAVQQQSKGA